MPKYTAKFYEGENLIDEQEGATLGLLFEYGQTHFKHCLKSTPNGWVFAFCEEQCEFNKVHKIECVLYEEGAVWEREKKGN